MVNPTSASSPIVSARPSFTSSWPRFLKDSSCQPGQRSSKSRLYLSTPLLSGSMSSTQGTRQPLGPALCSTTCLDVKNCQRQQKKSQMATLSRGRESIQSNYYLRPDDLPKSAMSKRGKLGNTFFTPLTGAHRPSKCKRFIERNLI